jgi:hypothetical protein
MVSVAVIWVALTTVTLLAVTPLPLTPTVAPERKLEPLNVTFTAVPWVALLGVTEVKVGPLPGAVTVKVRMLLLPAPVTTQVLCGPVAAEAEMVYVAVICVELTTTMLVWLSPEPDSLTCDPAVKFVPVSVTLADVPCAALEGLMDDSVGTPLVLFTVNGTLLLVLLVVTETL